MKKWNIIRRFTSRSQMCDITETDRNAGEHSRKRRDFSTYLTRLRWDFVILKIEQWEVNLRICMQLFCIHNFEVWSIANYLIGPDVLPRQFLSCAGSSLYNYHLVQGSLYNFHLFSGVIWTIFKNRGSLQIMGPQRGILHNNRCI